MLRAIETALAGYADRAREISRVAARVSKPDQDQVTNMVDLMANQHAAEAALQVARVADEATQSLLHVIA
jgi:flagellar basal body rod protein FlgC